MDQNEPSAIKSNWKSKAFALPGWGIVIGIVAGVLGLPAGVNSFRKEFPSAAEAIGIYMPVDARLNGDWAIATTCKPDPFDVGDLTEGKPGDEARGSGLDMTFEFGVNGISGSILSKGLSENFVFPEATMTGLASGQTAQLMVFEWIDSKPVTLANVNLTRTREGCLNFEVVNQTGNLFPNSAILVRREKGYYDSRAREGGLMARFLEKNKKENTANKPSGENKTKGDRPSPK